MIVDVFVERYPVGGGTRGWIRFYWPPPAGQDGAQALGDPIWVSGLPHNDIRVQVTNPPPSSAQSVENYLDGLRQRAREFGARR